MTTPRVTVPVDEHVIKRLQEEADHPGLGDSAMVFGPDLRALPRAYRSLSAAPAPEGGAVKRACVVFQEAIDDFEAEVADVMAEDSERADLWDREITVNIDALKTVMSAALATREEAPAVEAVAKAIEKIVERAVLRAGNRVIGIKDIRQKSAIAGEEIDAAVKAILALRAQPPAREEEGGTLDPAFVAWLRERDCLPNDDDGTIEWADIVCALNDWEADLTQAREDAQPVEVTIFCPKCALPHVDEGEWATTRHHKTHQCQGCGHEWRPFPFATVGVAHPAPDALREALHRAEYVLRSVQTESRDGHLVHDAGVALKALATLQAGSTK